MANESGGSASKQKEPDSAVHHLLFTWAYIGEHSDEGAKFMSGLPTDPEKSTPIKAAKPEGKEKAVSSSTPDMSIERISELGAAAAVAIATGPGPQGPKTEKRQEEISATRFEVQRIYSQVKTISTTFAENTRKRSLEQAIELLGVEAHDPSSTSEEKLEAAKKNKLVRGELMKIVMNQAGLG